jgi:capsular polysaccharide biosynthesis protein/Mrp family chromosome partitioning ATPase
MAGSYFAIRYLTPWPRYQATATVVIGSHSDFDLAALQMGQELAPTYVEWAQRRSVLQGAIQDLDLPLSIEELQERIDVRAVRNTQFVEITALSTDPYEAAAIANAVAWRLAQQPLPLVRNSDATQLSLRSDTRNLKRRIEAGEAELANLGTRLAEARSDQEVTALTGHLEVVQRNLDVWRRSYAELTAAYADYLDSRVAIAEEAIPPSQPLEPWINIIVAGLTGLVAATGLAFLLENLDNTVKTPAEVVEHLSAPAPGAIIPSNGPGRGPTWGPARQHLPKRLGKRKLRPADLRYLADSSRRLSANAARTKIDPLQGIVLVTSPTSERGKSITALGLAMSWAEMGRRTILVDASLDHPILHKWLGLSNEDGLLSLVEGSDNEQGSDVVRLLYPIDGSSLKVMTRGSAECVSPEVFLSEELENGLDSIIDQADLVLINGPPVLAGSGAAILAAKANYALLVLEARKTRVEDAQEAAEILTAVGSTNVGVIVDGSITWVNGGSAGDLDKADTASVGMLLQSSETLVGESR